VKEHRLQHSDPPTWCIDCGTFDCYCGVVACNAEETGRFDMDQPDNFERVLSSFFPEVAR
jgi:hypothetical protein